MDESSYLTGQFLLATPDMSDPRFERAVIAICAHDDEGALGIGVSDTIDGIGLHDLLAQFDIEPEESANEAIHFGGPVEPQRGFVLHSADWGGQDTVAVADRWALSGTIDILKAIASGRGPANWLVALGCASWSPGQLDGELTRPGWFSTPADGPELLFATRTKRRWQAAFDASGIDTRLLSGGGTA